MTAEEVDSLAAQMFDAFTRQTTGAKVKWPHARAVEGSRWRHIARVAATLFGVVKAEKPDPLVRVPTASNRRKSRTINR